MMYVSIIGGALGISVLYTIVAMCISSGALVYVATEIALNLIILLASVAYAITAWNGSMPIITTASLGFCALVGLTGLIFASCMVTRAKLLGVVGLR